MPLPCSARELDKLGDRLRETYPDTSGEDDLLFGQILAAYDEKLIEVTTQLSALGLQASPRIKTITTLVDKLRRQPTLHLRQVHDVAGARIVLPNGDGRLEQNVTSTRILREFRSRCPRAPYLIDRRTNPNHGYRAVHVIVYPDRIPVEIQIRTHMQDAWAQVIEKLGDEWGRGLRYGEPLPEPDAPAFPNLEGRLTRQQLMDALLEISNQIATMEEGQVALRRIELDVAELDARRNEDSTAGFPDVEDSERIAELREVSRASADRLKASMQEMASLLRALRGG